MHQLPGDFSPPPPFFFFQRRVPIFLMSYRLVAQDPKVDVSYFSSLCLSRKGKWNEPCLRESELKSGGFLLPSAKRAQAHANTFIQLKYKIPVKLRCKYWGGGVGGGGNWENKDNWKPRSGLQISPVKLLQPRRMHYS